MYARARPSDEVLASLEVRKHDISHLVVFAFVISCFANSKDVGTGPYNTTTLDLYFRETSLSKQAEHRGGAAMTESHQMPARARDASELASANSTSARFLGNQARIWMHTDGASFPIQQRPSKALKLSASASRPRSTHEHLTSSPNGESPWQTAHIATTVSSEPPHAPGSLTRPTYAPTASTAQMSPLSTQRTLVSSPHSSARSQVSLSRTSWTPLSASAIGPDPESTRARQTIILANASSPRTAQFNYRPPQSSNASSEVASPSLSRAPLVDPSPQQQNLTFPAPSSPALATPRLGATHGEILQHTVEVIRLRDAQTNFDMSRIIFLMEACIIHDLDALLMHQLYMAWTLDLPFLMDTLQFERGSLDGMLVLSRILGQNDAFTPSLAKALRDFPLPSRELGRPELQRDVNDVKKMLSLLASHWDVVCRRCFTRGYPLSPQEISVTFALPSPRLQVSIFTALSRHMQIFDGQSQDYERVIAARFLTFQQTRTNHPVAPDIEHDEWRHIFQQPLLDVPSESMTSANSAPQSMSPARNSHNQHPPAIAAATGQIQSNPSPEHYGIRSAPPSGPRFAPPVLYHTANSPTQSAPVPTQERGRGNHHNNAPRRAALHQGRPQQSQLQQSQPQQGQASSAAPQFQQHQHSAHHPQRVQHRFPSQRTHPQQYTQKFVTSNGHVSPGPQNGWIPTQQHIQGFFPQHQVALQAYANGPGQMNASQMPLAHQDSRPLMPPPNWNMPHATEPNPNRVALHQAHVRSPVARTVDLANQPSPSLRLYQVVTNLVIKPQALNRHTRYRTFAFEISRQEGDRKLTYTPPPHQTLTMGSIIFKQGSLRWRFKCIARDGKDTTPPNESDFCASSTSWPEHLFVSFNQLDDVTLRRRSHYTRDLPADLTAGAVPGANTLTFSFDESSREKALKKTYYIGVERVELFEHNQLLQSIPTTSTSDSLTHILNSMKGGTTTDDDDDDVAITNPTISIEVTDPFSARLWKTPVRGTSCRHRECFDLDNFMSSRRELRAQLAGPAGADDWKCPHCQRDARPQNLVIDGFLQTARDTLERHGKLDAKAILVREDGTWEAKSEADGENNGRAQSATPARNNADGMATGGGPRVERGGSARAEAAVQVVSLE